MKHKITLAFVLFFCCLLNLHAVDYYVDPARGNDNQNGTSENSAFRSLSRLNNVTLRPGDNVFLREGIYRNPGQTLMIIDESGLPDQWITIQNYPNEKPVLEFDSWTGIDLINGASYIKLKGLSIKGAKSKITLEEALNQPGSCANNQEGNAVGLYNGTGILAVGPNLKWSNPATRRNEVPHHITIEDCEVFDCTSSGMAFQQADYITIKNNKVYYNAWYTLYGTSGINLYQFVNTDNTTGIHNEISNNLMYGNELLVPQVPYCQFYDGNALIVDDFNHTQTGNYLDPISGFDAYSAKTLIKNNVSTNNGGSGLHFFLSSNCLIYNNTIVNNATQNNGSNGNAELRVGACSDFEIKNNIFKGTKLNAVGDNVNINYSHNYQEGNALFVDFANCTSCVTEGIAFANTDNTNASPYITVFEDVVIDAGSNIANVTDDFLMESRPFGNGFDIGAYELRGDGCSTWYVDADGDGVGSNSQTQVACEQPTGFVATSGDLCDNNPSITNPTIWYVDADGDGVGSDSQIQENCEQPTGFVATSGDFCDNDPNKTNPTIWYADADGDGVGSDDQTQESCEQPIGFVAISGDICDTDPNKTDPLDCGCGNIEGSCDTNEPVDPPTDTLCTSDDFSTSRVYSNAGNIVLFEGKVYENRWYTAGTLPTASGAWKLIKTCDTNGLIDCQNIVQWNSNSTYATTGTQVVYLNDIYKNKWYSKGKTPGETDVWQYVGTCSSNTNARLISKVDSFSDMTLKIYPTITENNLEMDLPSKNEINIFSITGKLMLNRTFSKGHHTIDVNHFSSGMYIIIAKKAQSSYTNKFIKK